MPNAGGKTYPSDADSLRVWIDDIERQIAELQDNRATPSLRLRDLADANLVPAPGSQHTPLTDGQWMVWNRSTGNYEPAGPIWYFSHAGPLTASTSPPLILPWASLVDGSAWALGTAGTTATTISVIAGGTTFPLITLAAGATGPVTSFGRNKQVPQFGLVTVTLTPGTGAADLGGWVGTP